MEHNFYYHPKMRHIMADRSRLDRLTKQKIGKVPGILDWVPETERQRSLFPYGIAASIILILGLGAVLWLRSRPGTVQTIPPRPIEATLRWQFGAGEVDSLVLGKMKQGVSYPAGAIQIARMGNQFFVREAQDIEAAPRDTLAYHFKVKGDENIQLFFQDATRMQLFPKTTLSFLIYPPGTMQKERQLACDGEALIDVRPNFEIPTVVKTLRQKITVLGTTFRLRDYKTEDTSAVFCYSGKVSVKDSGRTTKILDSAQRATVCAGHGIKVSNYDFPDAKWSSTELLFDFSNENLDDAMNEIAQWYGMSKVVFEGPIDRKTRGKALIGEVSRYLSLQQLLSILDCNSLHFSIQEKTILVKGSSGRPGHNH